MGARKTLKDDRTQNSAKACSTSRSPGAGRARLLITNGCFSGLEIKLGAKRTSLGSDIKCDICLDNDLVDPEHAVITRSAEGYFIEDMGSSQGTSVAGKKITKARLKSGNVISIGGFSLVFYC